MTRISGDWLKNPATQAVCAMLETAGHQSLLVGGCVRNALLGVKVADIDLATDALPDRVMQAATDAGLKAIPTGIEHGTVTVVSDGLPHEITTFRRDIKTTGRHATVVYTDQVKEDALRRDFTMNAIYAKRDGEILDPLGGIIDLKERRVRFIEDAEQRIKEDYLRILRFFRFHAWYGDPSIGLDPDGLAACAALSDGLDTLSKERVTAELLKLLGAADPAPSVASMFAAGCLTRILPGAEPRALPFLVHLEQSVEIALAPIRRLAVLGLIRADQHLRLSKAQARELEKLQSVITNHITAAELAYRHGRETALDMALVFAAMSESPLPPNLESDLAVGDKAKFPISAGDLMPDLHGPALGTRLAELESEWIASGFSKDRNALLR